MPITIIPLQNRPDLIPQLAQWAYDAWGDFNPHATVTSFKELFQDHLHEQTLPATYIALDNDTLVGMCSLRTQDGGPEELTPWLASLYVHPAYRRQGVGKQLVDYVTNKAVQLGYKRIHALCLEQPATDWYMRQGWQIILRDESAGPPVDVLCKNLKDFNF